MIKKIVVSIMGVFLLGLMGCKFFSKSKSGEDVVKTEAYYLGVQFGKSLMHEHENIDQDLVIRGIKDAFENSSDLPKDSELQEFFLAQNQRRYREANAEVFKAEETANQFIEKAVQDKKLSMAANGVYYNFSKVGKGQYAKANDSVVMKIKGTLADGSIFEDLSGNGKTLTAKYADLPAGLRILLQMAPKGTAGVAYLSPQQAFGFRGKDKVPPMAAVVYEFELVDIKKTTDKK